MSGFDAGALIFKIQTVGAAVFKQDQREAQEAFRQTGKSAQTAAGDITAQGTSTENTGRKARAAKQPLAEQGRATEDLGKRTRQTADEQARQTATTEQQIQSARQLSTALLAAGVAVAALVSISVAKYSSFDKAMSNVRAATMATTGEQKQLADAALEAGADTAYSANEAAAAEEELAKAGITTAEVVGGALNGALALAAAGQLEVARSAEIMATTLKQYRLPAEDAAHVSDLLAAGAGKAQGSVDDMALALQYVGPVAAGLNLSLEETTGTLALFASQGQIGERAGTGLRGVLMSLTSPSQLAKKTMDEYGVAIFNADGSMKSLAEVSQQLKTAFGGLTEAERSAALGRIFGNEQITAARVLYEGGAAAVEKWTTAVDDSGFAAEQARIRQDNLAGDVEKLGGAFDTAFIKTGSGANDVLRDMVQAITGIVDGYSDLDPAVQQSVLVVGAAATAFLLLWGGGLKAAVGLAELKRASDVFNVSMRSTALIAGGAAIAITGIIAIVAALASAQADAQRRAQSYADALRDGGDAAETMLRNLQEVNTGFLGLQDFGSAADALETLGLSFDTVSAAIEGNADAMQRVRSRVTEAKDAFNQWTGEGKDAYNAAVILEDAVNAEAAAYARGKKDKEQATKATEENTGSVETATQAYMDAAGSVEDLHTQLSQLIDQINSANEVGQDAVTANIDYQDSLAKLDEQIANVRNGTEGYAAGLDTTTQAGRDNLSLLNDMAAKAWDAADAQLALDGNTENFQDSLEDSRQALIDRAMDLGATREEAELLADQILKIPSEVEIEAIAETARAQDSIEDFIRKNAGRRFTMYLDAIASGGGSGRAALQQADGGKVEFYAAGGRSEHHVAQFARAGTMRVWAEPETGGEAYIPLAPAKRARSTAILEEVASDFGYVLVPAGTQSFAEGSPVSGGRDARPVQVTQQLTFQQTDPTLQARAMSREVVRALSST